MTLVMDDEQRRRVRASMGRGGKATRAEVRVWMQRVLGVALKNTPEPRRRRPNVRTAPLPLEHQRHLASCVQIDGRWFCAADCRHHVVVDVEAERAEVTDETTCKNCGRARERHGKMMLTCLPATGVKPGARFSPAA
jgi:hypothetical protein